jgi:hypothetical protein
MNDPRLPSGQGMPQPAQPLRPQPAVPIQPKPVSPGGLPKPGLPPTMPAPQPIDSEPIALIEEEAAAATAIPGGAAVPAKSKIKLGPQITSKHHDWKRQPFANGEGICRVKSFHGKYSDQGLEHMDDVINEWLDGHPGIEIKFITSTVGVFEGKIREPALVLNVWY